MSKNDNAKKQTQGTWAIQREDVNGSNPGCSPGVDGYSSQPRDESLNSSGKNRSEGNQVGYFLIPTLGKIIDRLIDSWRDREKEATDCLDWYNEQVEKCRKEIGSLEEIKAELKSQTE
ncbi:MAG: hypothetical protein AAGJ08_25125 [Cyanobacteria bacterium P01_H01_bin.35]